MAQAKQTENASGEDQQDYTEDGTVDLKGRPILRSKTGRWKACSFIVVYEVFERLAYQGIQSNLVVYLTKELHQGTVTASNNVTNWSGAVWMTPILGAYVADAHLGRFWTFLISSAIYLVGMIMLTLAVSVPTLKPPSCTGEDCAAKASSLQVGMFFFALYIIVVGNGGTKPNISTLGAEQFDEFEPREKAQKLSFFNWWVFSIFIGFLVSETFVVYLQDNVGWSLGYGLPTAGLGVSIFVFLAGTPFYRHKVPSGSSFTTMLKVFVAALRKWKVSLPDDPKELYELSLEDYIKSGTNKIDHTPSLRFLDKAATITKNNGPIRSTEWTLRPVTEVEETKKITKLIPVLLATFVPAIISAQVHTLFVKQGTTLDRSLGPHFDVPPACLAVITTISLMITLALYDSLFVPAMRKYTKNPRGITMLQRLGTGLVIHVIVSVAACLAEKKRLGVARANGIVEKNGVVPLSVFVLLPQFALVGIADVFLEVSKQEFFYDQAPEGMKSIGASLFCASRGVGSFLSSVVLRTVSDVTKRNGRSGWVLNNLNVSHLDYYYAFLAVLAFVNFLFFLVVAKSFVYNVEAKKPSVIVRSP